MPDVIVSDAFVVAMPDSLPVEAAALLGVSPSWPLLAVVAIAAFGVLAVVDGLSRLVRWRK